MTLCSLEKMLWHAQSVNCCLFSIAQLRAFIYDTYSKRSIHSMVVNSPLSLSQCTLVGPMYIVMPLGDPVYTGIPLGDPVNIAGYPGTPLEKYETVPHWNATREALTIAAYIGTLLEGLSQPTHTQTHIVKQSSNHASLKGQDDGVRSSKWTGLCKFSY